MVTLAQVHLLQALLPTCIPNDGFTPNTTNSLYGQNIVCDWNATYSTLVGNNITAAGNSVNLVAVGNDISTGGEKIDGSPDLKSLIRGVLPQ